MKNQHAYELESSSQTHYEKKPYSYMEKFHPQNLNLFKKRIATLQKIPTTKQEKSVHTIMNKLQTPTVKHHNLQFQTSQLVLRTILFKENNPKKSRHKALRVQCRKQKKEKLKKVNRMIHLQLLTL
jgi:hypothetical protein